MGLAIARSLICSEASVSTALHSMEDGTSHTTDMLLSLREELNKQVTMPFGCALRFIGRQINELSARCCHKLIHVGLATGAIAGRLLEVSHGTLCF